MTVLNLEPFGTGIKCKEPLPRPDSKLFKIGSFSDRIDEYKKVNLYTEHTFPISVSGRIMNIVTGNEVLEWVIGESHGGLFVYSQFVHDPARFDTIVQLELYVYLTEKIFTFCQLKYSDSLSMLHN